MSKERELLLRYLDGWDELYGNNIDDWVKFTAEVRTHLAEEKQDQSTDLIAKPLNGDQILEAFGKLEYDYRTLMCFAEGVRFAEAHHRIGEDNE